MKNFQNMNEVIKAENQKKTNIRIYIAALLAVQMLVLPMSGCTVASGTSSATGSTSWKWNLRAAPRAPCTEALSPAR